MKKRQTAPIRIRRKKAKEKRPTQNNNGNHIRKPRHTKDTHTQERRTHLKAK